MDARNDRRPPGSDFRMQLEPFYESCRREGRWDDYAAALADEGLTWWFDLKIPTLAFHVFQLFKEGRFRSSDRLTVLRAVTDPASGLETMENAFRRMIRQNDLEYASLAAGAGIHKILDSGRNFARLNAWRDRADQLLPLKDALSPLARASLSGFLAMADVFHRGNLQAAADTCRTALELAEQAESISQRIWLLSAHGYCQTWIGDFSRVELALFDAEPLTKLPEASTISLAFHEILYSLYHTLTGEAAAGKKMLMTLTEQPGFDLIPESVWMLVHAHILLAAAFEGSGRDVEDISRKIKLRAVPVQNHYFHGYIHFCLGAVQLLKGRPYKAKLHCLESMQRSEKAQSQHVERLAALLYGQALADLGETREAREHLEAWITVWENLGNRLFLASGCQELTGLFLREKAGDSARACYRRALAVFPEREAPVALFRTPDFLERLKRELDVPRIEISDIPDGGQYPICIRTLGEFQVKVGERVLYDRKWRGGRTKQLLKTLIAFGAERVSSDLIQDMLWPDSDGDKAVGNLKVALSRLRRIGLDQGQKPLPWIEVRERRVSLSEKLCFIDSVRFSRLVDDARGGADSLQPLKNALDMYGGDFLVHDLNDPWIIRHRNLLKEHFIRCVLDMADFCLESGRFEEAEHYLLRGLEKNRLHEGLYARLMTCFLKMGFPSNAVQVYRQAREILTAELGIEPGPALVQLMREAGGV